MADEQDWVRDLKALVISDTRNADNTARMETYHEALFTEAGKPALDYLKHERGFIESTIRHFKLGFVAEPHPVDRSARGYISIPYTNDAGVFDIRFRRTPQLGENAPKYWQPSGSRQTIFNVSEIQRHEDFIIISEGELTAVMAHQIGLPCVAYPGVESVKEYHRHLFEGFERVYLLGDGDEAGQGFNDRLAKMLDNAYPISLPPGEDLDSYIKNHGADKARELIFGK